MCSICVRSSAINASDSNRKLWYSDYNVIKYMNIIAAASLVFVNKKYLLGFLLTFVIIFWLLIYIPAHTIPGNDFAFQLSLLKISDFIILIVLSILTTLTLMFNLYLIQHKKSKTIGISLVGQTGTVLISSLITAFLGTISCIACGATFLGFLGLGGTLFLMENRILISLVSITLLTFAVYFTAGRVLGVCKIGCTA